MAKVLLVGCGDLGGEVARLLSLANHVVTGVRISNKPVAANVDLIQVDVTQAHTLHALEKLNPNIVIYCVPAGGQTDAQYHAAYVQGLKNVLATQANNHTLQHVFFVSSTRVYGANAGEILDENSPATPADFGGERLLEAEKLLTQLPCKATALRLSGIYGAGRLYLANMAKDLARWPAENHWSNRIHRDDAARFIAFLCEKETVESCYIVTDDMPTQQYEVLAWLANQQGVDASAIKHPNAQSGKRLSNARLRATGFNLEYPNYQLGYAKVLQNA